MHSPHKTINLAPDPSTSYHNHRYTVNHMKTRNFHYNHYRKSYRFRNSQNIRRCSLRYS